MPGLVRKTDHTNIHGNSCSETVPSSYSSNIYCNGILIARNGDYVEDHSCSHGEHDGATIISNHNVYANGKSVTTINDTTSCGATFIEGSSDCFVN